MSNNNSKSMDKAKSMDKNKSNKKILDRNNHDFYLFENMRKLSLGDFKKLLKETTDIYNKAKQFAIDNKLKHTFIPSATQHRALQYMDLNNFEYTKIAMGGGISGGKTALVAYWMISNALKYPDTAYAIGRDSLTVIDKSTVPSFIEMLSILQVPKGMYKYNSQKHELVFKNGSIIYFMELRRRPDDPEYSRIRGLQITAAACEEANELNEVAVNHLITRTGRKNNKKYGIQGKTVFTFNPAKNFVKAWFYDPWERGIEKEKTIYIPSLVFDNPFVQPEYIETLWDLPANVKNTQLLGNFNYEDSENALVEYDEIVSVFNNVLADTSARYLTIDPSGRKGKDDFVFTIWHGWQVVKFITMRGMDNEEAIINEILKICDEHKIPIRNTCIDQIGVGEFIPFNGRVSGMYPFKSSNTPLPEKATPYTIVNKYGEVEMDNKIQTPKYLNLRSQMAWVLARKIKRGEFSIVYQEGQTLNVEGVERNMKEVLEEELSLLRNKNYGKESMKKQLIPKNEMKEYIGGRSPNFLDTFLQRGVFELTKEYDIISERKSTPIQERRFFKRIRKKINFR